MSVFFRAAYLFGFKPWDSGVPPPELVAVVEGKDSLTPGKALDLGSGTGTNCIYMAQHGWEAGWTLCREPSALLNERRELPACRPSSSSAT